MGTLEQGSRLQTSVVDGGEVTKLAFGSQLIVESTGNYPMRFNTELVGLQHGQYVIVRIPDSTNWNKVKGTLREHDRLVVRGLLEGQTGACIAFNSYIMWFVSVPTNLLFIAFPRQIEMCELRRFPRLETSIQAKMLSNGVERYGSEQLEGDIRNVSLGGCCFSFSRLDLKNGIFKRPVVVEVLNDRKNALQLQGFIRNHRREQQSISVGIEFQQPAYFIEQQLKKCLIHPARLRR